MLKKLISFAVIVFMTVTISAYSQSKVKVIVLCGRYVVVWRDRRLAARSRIPRPADHRRAGSLAPHSGDQAV